MSDFNVGFVVFPHLTQLDFTGPLQVLARLPQSATHIIAKSEASVPSDCGLSFAPTCTFSSCPPLDLICIPGGVRGVVGAIGDRPLSSSACKRLRRSTSPRFAPVRSSSGSLDCSKAGGQRLIGLIRISCLSSGRRTRRAES